MVVVIPVVSQSKYNLLTILGATASGKTALAVAIANKLGGEIISADSRQVFKGMDIGAGKDLHEYGQIPYHLINILNAGEEFSVFAFQQLFVKAFQNISMRQRLPILCGGSGMYLDAALRGYRMLDVPENTELRENLATKSELELIEILLRLKPAQHNKTDTNDRLRTLRAIEIASYELEHKVEQTGFPELRPLVIGICWERKELRRRITERLRYRLENGMLQEVQDLYDNGVAWERLDYYGLEYRYVGAYLRNELTYNDMFQKLNSAIHNFAKRQENWFRRMEKHGVAIQWINGGENLFADAIQLVKHGFV